MSRRHWIPPIALAAGQLAHGTSWILLIVLALHRPFALGAPALGWLHLVALGWLTTTALAILAHVIPGFTDATSRGERIARGALFVFEAGARAATAGPCAWIAMATNAAIAARRAVSFRKPPDSQRTVSLLRSIP